MVRESTLMMKLHSSGLGGEGQKGGEGVMEWEGERGQG